MIRRHASRVQNRVSSLLNQNRCQLRRKLSWIHRLIIFRHSAKWNNAKRFIFSPFRKMVPLKSLITILASRLRKIRWSQSQGIANLYLPSAQHWLRSVVLPISLIVCRYCVQFHRTVSQHSSWTFHTDELVVTPIGKLAFVLRNSWKFKYVVVCLFFEMSWRSFGFRVEFYEILLVRCQQVHFIVLGNHWAFSWDWPA